MKNRASGTPETDMLLNGICIPLELLDRHGQFISANHAFLELLQIPAIQKGEPCHRFMACPLHCRHAMDETCILTDVIRTRQPVKHSAMIGNRCFMIQANPIFDPAGEIAFFVKSYTDISEQTERIQQENVLNRCLETFFLEPDMMTGITRVSREICRYMEAFRLFIMKFDLKKHSVDHFFEYADDASLFFSDVHDRKFSPQEKWFRRFQQHDIVLLDDVNAPEAKEELESWTDFFQKSDTRSIYVSPIYVDGALWGDFGITYERKMKAQPELRRNVLKHTAQMFGELLSREQMRQQVLDALREAQQANKAKSFFLASVSHELRTPLNAVIGFTELLKMGGIPPAETTEYLNSIGGSANALLDLINDVLDLSRLESGELDIVKEQIDFKHLAESLIAVFRPPAQRKGLRLNADIKSIPSLKLDAARTRQILHNLLDNAVKFTVSGGIDFHAAFHPDRTGGGQLRFSIRDTGPGIPEGDLRKLTEPFGRLSRMRGTNAANHGTGLGLAVVKKLLSVMDGDLSIESKPGQGSTLTVCMNHVETMEPASSTAARMTPAGKLPPILLVDDVEMNLKVLSAICRKAGFTEIVTANSGEQAFRLLLERRFGLLLTDLWMPEMNGEVLVKKIRADQRLTGLPVVAVTADMEARDHFDLHWFRRVLHKPVTPEKIRDLLTDL